MERRVAWPATPELLARLCRCLLDGLVIVFPTDTLLAIGCGARAAGGVERVLDFKGRSLDRGLPLVAAGMDQVRDVVDTELPGVDQLARAFWPGPLSLVLPARSDGGLAAGIAVEGAIAIRIPGHDVARSLAAAIGQPLVATSANRAGGPPAARLEDLDEGTVRAADVLISAGPCPGGAPSTILDLAHGPPRILRVGAIPAVVLNAVLARHAQIDTSSPAC